MLHSDQRRIHEFPISMSLTKQVTAILLMMPIAINNTRKKDNSWHQRLNNNYDMIMTITKNNTNKKTETYLKVRPFLASKTVSSSL